jgi:hypothetical protein
VTGSRSQVTAVVALGAAAALVISVPAVGGMPFPSPAGDEARIGPGPEPRREEPPTSAARGSEPGSPGPAPRSST